MMVNIFGESSPRPNSEAIFRSVNYYSARNQSNLYIDIDRYIYIYVYDIPQSYPNILVDGRH